MVIDRFALCLKEFRYLNSKDLDFGFFYSVKAKGMGKQSLKRRLAIAHHEAGHAVAAFRGREIREVCISAVTDDPRYDGNIQHNNPLYGQHLEDGDERLSGYYEGELIIALAGPEAECRHDSGTRIAGNDLDVAQEILDRFVGSRVARERYLRLVQRETRALVKREWPAIERVAAALLRHGRLTGGQLAQLIREGG
jgi:hypothetical protein